MKKLSLLFALLALGSVNAYSAPVNVSYSVTGSPGDWNYNFTVNNNLSGGLDIYAFVVYLPNFVSEVSAPANWTFWTIFYPVEWCYVTCNSPFSDLKPGQSLSSFIAKDASTSKLSSVSWLVAAIETQGPFNNPVFTGVASEIPIPGALPLFATGVAALAYAGRRKRKAARAAA